MKTTSILQQISNQMHIHNVFDDFLNMTVSAFSMNRDEERYLKCSKKYNENQIKLFGDTLGALFLDYESVSSDGEWDDIIGKIFEELLLSNAKTGQFFTPKSLCDLMAAITQSDIKEGTINDPSSGSSRNLIAHSRLDLNNRFNFTYIAQDLDERCCLMSVINFVMYGLKGYVIHCDTLSMEIYKGWRIFMPETGLFVVPISIEDCEQILTKKTDDKPEIQINKQLTLF
jgi:type I restriction-modification system DNA methylase subunit